MRRVAIHDPLSPALLEECLAYTLKARLAPNWNKVGDWFLAGRQFLHQADQIPAVKMSLHLADRQVVFVLSATVMRFPLLQPEDLGVDPGWSSSSGGCGVPGGTCFFSSSQSTGRSATVRYPVAATKAAYSALVTSRRPSPKEPTRTR